MRRPHRRCRILGPDRLERASGKLGGRSLGPPGEWHRGRRRRRTCRLDRSPGPYPLRYGLVLTVGIVAHRGTVTARAVGPSEQSQYRPWRKQRVRWRTRGALSAETMLGSRALRSALRSIPSAPRLARSCWRHRLAPSACIYRTTCAKYAVRTEGKRGPWTRTPCAWPHYPTSPTSGLRASLRRPPDSTAYWRN